MIATFSEAEAVLTEAAIELATIHRAKDFSLWSLEAPRRLEAKLWNTEPFVPYRELGVFCPDGFCAMAAPHLGAWVVSQLAERKTPVEIVGLFQNEAARNVGIFEEVIPLFGVELDENYQLADGLTLERRTHDLVGRIFQTLPFANLAIPEQTGFLRHRFEVRPAFLRKREPETAASILPISSERASIRERVRLACLLASAGAVETPVQAVIPETTSLFGRERGSLATHPTTQRPVMNFPVRASEIAEIFVQLRQFQQFEPLARAIDRLGRSRLSNTAADQFLDIGRAAEFVLMHGDRDRSKDISRKIRVRAAWLLGVDAAERQHILDEMKKLYTARSKAAHEGSIPMQITIDGWQADALVRRLIRTLLGRGDFADWNAVTHGEAP